MTKKTIVILIACALTVALSTFLLIRSGFFSSQKHIRHPAIDQEIALRKDANDALALVVEPDDKMAPVVSLISQAAHSVDLVMYTLDDSSVEAALAAAEKRGAPVRVLLNAGYQGVPSKKDTTVFASLAAAGVSVQWSPSYFALTHQKTLVVDGKEALIMTFNLDHTYYKKDRDFGIEDTDAADVAAIESAFNADWNKTKAAAPDGSDLIWSPGSTAELVSLIASSKKTLLVYNEEMDDEAIENALESASRNGVQVYVLMSMSTEWLPAFSALAASGVHIRTFSEKAPLYVHAKMIVSDSTLAFLGSENFSDASLEANRELGILFSNTKIIASLDTVFQSDWMKADVLKP
jgi:phosphatidylserine/phosphatidylglycerophosphate/cardiolipin synthase-like enzyme